MIHWFPYQTDNWIRENQKCCYCFKERDNFIIIGVKSDAKRGNDDINLQPMKVSKRKKFLSGLSCFLSFSYS